MNKQELQNEINKTKEHLANMEKMLEKCEGESWEPKQEDLYWFVNSYLNVTDDCWVNTNDQRNLYNAYNFFRTKEQAKAEAEKILIRRQLEDIARRLNKGKKADWQCSNMPKYFLGVNIANKLIQDFNLTSRDERTYCLDPKFKDVAIQEIGEERLKKYLRGE